MNESWRQHPTKHQLYGQLPPTTKTIRVRRTRHTGHCQRSRDELISDVLLWTPTSGRAKAGRPARTYIQQRCEDTGCSLEDLPEVMNDRGKWQERVRDILASGTTWWWWWCMFEVHTISFQTFFVWALLLIVHTWNSVIRMELWTGALSWWKCHWPDLKSVGLFPWNLFLNPLKSST